MKATKINQTNLIVSKSEAVPLHSSLVKMEGKPDIEIWENLRMGSEEAFSFIYFKYFQQLFNYGHQFSTDREFVKDIIQDLFVEIKLKHKRLRELKTSIKPYLFKSLRRKLLEKRSKISFVGEEKIYVEHSFQIEFSIENQLIQKQVNKEVLKKLEEAFQKLPARQKEVLINYYFEGLDYNEITEVMGFSKIEHARVMAHRGIKNLRKELGNDFGSLITSVFFAVLPNL
ncbi:RNA polymerase sigma factor [Flexithrix dorotheae]|uniref:RNA polymerase sigma factor n=1 Tax=Flexithrix dorotheae TaxID=70993 RepID=UPI0012F8EBEF|nr:sigma-70 family RNA polymerase sigma factor [Flexithrix dorotheae]